MSNYIGNYWEKIKDNSVTPEQRSGHSSIVFKESYLFIFGGYSDNSALNDMFKFEIQNKARI